MKNLVLTVVILALALFIMLPNLSWAAEDGAALFKTKCAACHGPNGEGKAAMKTPDLKSDQVQKKTDAELTDMIANGGPGKKAAHAFEKKGLTADQVKELVAFIRSLKK